MSQKKDSTGLFTAEYIISIIQKQGYFFVSPKHSFDRVRRKCNRMRAAGILTKRHWSIYGRFGDYYVLHNRYHGQPYMTPDQIVEDSKA